jgi:hypothetical protein
MQLNQSSLPDSTDNGIIKCYALAMAGRQAELITQLKRVAANLQHEWSLLPEQCVSPKIAMLQKLNQWAEIAEGSRVVQEIKKNSVNNMPVCWPISNEHAALRLAPTTRVGHAHPALLHLRLSMWYMSRHVIRAVDASAKN